MTEWTTLSVKENTLTRFRDIKEQLDETQDAPDHSADSFLNALLDTWEVAEKGYYDGEKDDRAENDTDMIESKLDQIQSAQANTVSEALNIAEEQDIDGAKREILNRLDDLQSQLPKDVAGELR